MKLLSFVYENDNDGGSLRAAVASTKLVYSNRVMTNSKQKVTVSQFFQPRRRKLACSSSTNALPETDVRPNNSTTTSTSELQLSSNCNAALAEASSSLYTITGTAQKPVTLLEDDDDEKEDVNGKEDKLLVKENQYISTMTKSSSYPLDEEYHSPISVPRNTDLGVDPVTDYEYDAAVHKKDKMAEVPAASESTTNYYASSDTSNVKKTKNMFANFAFREESSTDSNTTTEPSSSSGLVGSIKKHNESGLGQWAVPKTTTVDNVGNKRLRTIFTTSIARHETAFVSQKRNDDNNSKKKKRKTSSSTNANQFVKLKTLSVEEQERITCKWHSLADTSAPLEVRRFQVLVATRLHARCQEPSVRKAMQVLREAFSADETTASEGLTVNTLAQADPEVLAGLLSNLQFYRVKAQQIVTAAQQIKSQFGGVVPEDEHSLLQITGVGKVFGDLLAFVNTRKAHSRATL